MPTAGYSSKEEVFVWMYIAHAVTIAILMETLSISYDALPVDLFMN
jgi:hypothetical protein